MPVQITIIGLGQIGASMGLALASHKDILRIGHDKKAEVEREALKKGSTLTLSCKASSLKGH